VSSIASLLGEFTRPDKSSSEDFVDIITFIESIWGLNTKLWPAQKFLLKLYYGVPLSTDKPEIELDGKVFHGVPVHDMFMLNVKYELSEREFLQYLYNEGRCNVKDQSQIFTDLNLAIGRRGSKSVMTSMIAAYEIYKLLSRHNPHEFYQMLDVGMISISAIATSGKQAAGLYKVARGYITRCRFFDPYIVSDTEEGMTFRTQSDIDRLGPKCKGTIELLFRPAIGRGLRGPANIVCVFDEFAHFIGEGQSSAEECYDAATPSTAQFKDPKTSEPEGRVICISSPLNRAGLFYKLFQQGLEGHADGRLCIQAPTWEFNPIVSSKYLRNKYNEDVAHFLCEFGAEFSDRYHGWIRREEELLQCIDPELRPRLSTYVRQPHFMGVDVGLVNNGTAISICHLEDDLIIHDYIEARYAGQGPYSDRDQLDFESIADWIQELCKKFYIFRGSFDQREGLPLEQALKKRGLTQFSMEYSTRDKNSKMYQAFKLLMLDKKLRLFDYPIPEGEEHCDYIKELLELQEQRVNKYQIIVEAPNLPGKYDDMSDALCRAVWLAQDRIGDRKFAKLARQISNQSGLQKGGPNNLRSYHMRKMRRNNYVRKRGPIKR